MLPPDLVLGGTFSGVSLAYDLDISQTSLTSIEASFTISNMSVTPDTYKVAWVKLLTDGTPSGDVGDSGEESSSSDIVSIDSLEPGSTYKFTGTAYFNSTHGTAVASTYTMSLDSLNATVISSSLDPKKLTVGKSYMTLTNDDTSATSYSLVYRDFDAISVPVSPEVSTIYQTNSSGVGKAVNTYTTKCYSFGTTMFMDSNIDKPNQGGGLGFFVSGSGSDGYYIIVESTSLSVSEDHKSIRIVKVIGKKVIVLKDTQSNATNTLEGIYGGKAYSIDVKVKISGVNVEIIAYVNGFKITATDKTDQLASIPTKIVGPSKTVGLMCSKGVVKFDYVYGTSIELSQYKDSDYILNFYQGQFSNDLLTTSFGELTYYSNNSTDNANTKKDSVDEFGTVVREIVKKSIKFDSRPSYPSRWTTGSNKLAQVIGSKVSNFGAEAYVLNNSSSTIPLSDNNLASFYVYGNTLGQSGTLEYSTDELADYVTKEPVIFESQWLQNLTDVKALAEWIKTKVVNRGKTVTMTVFGNPLIAIGDIITIKYIYQGLAGTEKFIITRIGQSFNEGLETTLTCRTLG